MGLQSVETFVGFRVFGVAAGKSFVSCTIKGMCHDKTEGGQKERWHHHAQTCLFSHIVLPCVHYGNIMSY